MMSPDLFKVLIGQVFSLLLWLGVIHVVANVIHEEHHRRIIEATDGHAHFLCHLDSDYVLV